MRLIDADAAKHWTVNNMRSSPLIQSVNYVINHAPTIDPVEAAGGCYCMECGFRETPHYDDFNGYIYCNEQRRYKYPRDFCSGGEREEATP